MTMPTLLQSKVLEEDISEAANRAVENGLLRKVDTNNGVRYEITQVGWRFLKEYQNTQGNLEEASAAPENNGGLQRSAADTPELLDFLSEPWRSRLAYEIMKPTIGVVIPTLNEVNTIGNVVDEISEHMEYHSGVLIIDASDDDTALVAEKFGARVLRQGGQGKGSALRQAFYELDSDIIVILDGDASMRPQEIPSLVRAIIAGADMAKGSRFLRGGYSEDLSFIRKVGNLIFVSLVNMFWSGNYTDLCYGLMAFKRSSLERLKPCLKSQHFQIETEICIKAKKLGMKVVEVPSVELRRMHGVSKLIGIRDSFRIFQTIVHEMLSPA